MNISDRLSQLATSYHREAHKCSSGRAYLGATVMQVAALEAGLHAMCFLFPREVKRTAVYASKRFRGKRNRALEFTLYQLIKIADELSWFPPKHAIWGGKRATLAGFSHEIRKVRNCVHPAVWATDHSDLKFTKGVYGIVYEVCDVATSWLLHRVERSLLKAMEREKKAGKGTRRLT
jgi:hypothetical protein